MNKNIVRLKIYLIKWDFLFCQMPGLLLETDNSFQLCGSKFVGMKPAENVGHDFCNRWPSSYLYAVLPQSRLGFYLLMSEFQTKGGMGNLQWSHLGAPHSPAKIQEYVKHNLLENKFFLFSTDHDVPNEWLCPTAKYDVTSLRHPFPI